MWVAPAGGPALAFKMRGGALLVTFLPLACNLRGELAGSRLTHADRGNIFIILAMLCVGIGKQLLASIEDLGQCQSL
jgi:hypothetical protein